MSLVQLGTTALTSYTAVALSPVWVPYREGEEPKPERKGRAPSKGPNGEPAESGKWQLAFPDGHIYTGPKISVSALDTASECLHKWALDRLDGFEKQQNHKAELGGYRHDELEAWQKYGKMTDTPGMAKVFSHFPTPGTCESEVYFGFQFGRPGHEVVIAGYIDVRESVLGEARSAVAIVKCARCGRGASSDKCAACGGQEIVSVGPGEVFAEPDYIAKCGECNGLITEDVGCPACGKNEVVYEMSARPLNSTIRDLKTTGDFRWMKSPAQLKANIQAAAYAFGEMLRIDRYTLRKAALDDITILKWTYAHLKEKKDGTVSIGRVETVCERDPDGATADPGAAFGVTIDRREALKVLVQYLPLAERLQEAILTKKSATEMEKSPEACRMYGGCPWRELEILPTKVLNAPGGELDTSALDARPGEVGYVALEEKGDIAANGKRFACVPPTHAGGGVLAFVRQDKARSGVLPQSKVLAALDTSTAVEASNKEKKNTSGLSTRFAKTGTSNQTSGKALQAHGAKKMGFADRFKKDGAGAAATTTTGNAEKPSTVSAVANNTAKTEVPKTAKVDQKAEATGNAAVATGATVAKPGGSLKDRLKVVAGGNTAVTKAAENAPVNNVQSQTVATGINPPDAAPEWTQEQQDAEAARIAAKAGGVTDGGSDAPKAKKGKKGITGATPEVSEPNGDVNAWAVDTLDKVARALLDAGQRRQASAVMGAAASF